MYEKEYEVVVIGGGLSGITAALSVAEHGRKVLLVEKRASLGWEITSAFELDLPDIHLNRSQSVVQSFLNRIRDVGGLRNGCVDPAIVEMLLGRLVTEVKCGLLLYTRPVKILRSADGISGIVVGNKNGEITIRGRICVDATENGFIWRETEVGFANLTSVAGRQSFFLNGVDEDLSLPRKVYEMKGVENITLRPTAWKGEIRVTFELSEDTSKAARQAIPGVLSHVRRQFPQLTSAMFTHSGHEIFPLDIPSYQSTGSSKHSTLKNLFGAGLWTISDPSERRELNTLAGRIELGEKVGREVLGERITRQGVDLGSSTDYSSNLPEHHSEIVVIGAGTAGALAALAAARQGVKVTLLEAGTILGGTGTAGCIHGYSDGLPGGLQDEVDAQVRQITVELMGNAHNKRTGRSLYHSKRFHPEAKKIVLQRMAEQAGVNIVLDTVVTGVKLDSSVRLLQAVVAIGNNGSSIYKADVFVDCTGDGDVVAMAGAPFSVGRETDNLQDIFSQPAKYIDGEGDLRGMNMDAGYLDATDVGDLTRARQVGIQHYWQEQFTPDNRLLYLAPLIGIRQSRQIIGDYQLTFEDQTRERKFDDVIAYAHGFYDNHAFDYENESNDAVLWVWLLGNFHRFFCNEVPYRCLLPKKIEGLLVACRALSLTYDAHHQFRMQRDMQRIGEAAGVAAAISVKQNSSPRHIDVREVQKILMQTGALSKKDPSASLPSQDQSIEDLIEQLESPHFREAVWILAHASEPVLPAISKALCSSSRQVRFWAAVILAMKQKKEALGELLSCVKDRWDYSLKGTKTVAVWKSAIVLLGSIGDVSAVHVLVEILRDSSVELDILIATVRALGKIGDKVAVPHLIELLERGERYYRDRWSRLEDYGLEKFKERWKLQELIRTRVKEDVTWQFELALAEALARLDCPQLVTIERHLDDNRAYVRGYARKVERATSFQKNSHEG